MVRHIDMAETKLGFNKFTLNELAEALKVSYGLARTYALQWVKDGRLNKFKRSKSNSPDKFQFVRRKMKDYDNYESIEELERVLEQEALAPAPTEEEVEEVVTSYLQDDGDIYPPSSSFELDPCINDYSLEEKILEEQEKAPPEMDYTVAPTVDMILQQIMQVSLNWKTRALTAEKDNATIKQALADFLKGLKSEDL